MNSISPNLSVKKPMSSGNPWGAVAPRAHVGETEYKLVPDSVQITPGQPVQVQPAAGGSNVESLSKQSGIAPALAAASSPPLMVVLLGDQESSKKDQAETIAQNLGLVHLHMGDMIKQEVNSGSELGLNLKRALDSGDESPALLLYDLVARRVEQKDVQERGMVLDAYPEDFQHHKAESLLEELEGLQVVAERIDSVRPRLNHATRQKVDDLGHVPLMSVRVGLGPARPDAADDGRLLDEQ